MCKSNWIISPNNDRDSKLPCHSASFNSEWTCEGEKTGLANTRHHWRYNRRNKEETSLILVYSTALYSAFKSLRRFAPLGDMVLTKEPPETKVGDSLMGQWSSDHLGSVSATNFLIVSSGFTPLSSLTAFKKLVLYDDYFELLLAVASTSCFPRQGVVVLQTELGAGNCAHKNVYDARVHHSHDLRPSLPVLSYAVKCESDASCLDFRRTKTFCPC